MNVPARLTDILDANPCAGAMRSGSRRFWTGREEKVLRDHYTTGGLPVVLPLLPGRTAKATYQRAGQLGLRAPGSFGPKPPPYTTNDHIDAAIRRVYQGSPTKGQVTRLAVTLGRPRYWVSKRATHLGLTVPRYKPLPWSPAEVAIITARSTQRPGTIRLALERDGFARTETAIVVQLKRLGISRATDDPDVYTSRALAEAFGVDSHVIVGWVEKGWLRAKKAPGPTGKYKIRRKDVRAFVVENAAAVDIRKVAKEWFIDLLAGSGLG